MESQIQSFTDWLLTSPAGLTIYALGVALPAWGIYKLWQRNRSIKRYIQTIKEMHELAPPEMVSGMVKFAESKGFRDQALLLLSKVRRTYGHNGVRKGHLHWIVDVVEGRDEEVDPPPACDKAFGEQPSSP